MTKPFGSWIGVPMVDAMGNALHAGSFEGAQYSAGGQSTSNNMFMVDGAYDNDDRTQSGPGMQTRMTIDTTAEYQVLTHEFGAEYGGASGAIINAVTKSGSNEYHGRAAFYVQDSSLDATNYFLKKAGAKPADSGVKTLLGDIGGPILRNKAFFFVNVERLRIRQAADLLYPADAAPLAVSYSTVLPVSSENYFAPNTGQVNGALARRSAGSTFKAFTYLLALERDLLLARLSLRVERLTAPLRSKHLRASLCVALLLA